MTLTTTQIRLLKVLRGNGFTQEEIAQELGVSRKTVENHLRKLRANYLPLPIEAQELVDRASAILIEIVDDYARKRKK